MAHAHAGNAGDYLKHTILADVLEAVGAEFEAVSHSDPYCGEGLFDQPRFLFTPNADNAKVKTFRRYQPAVPDYYFGSPMVAAAALGEHPRSRLRLADEDTDAVAKLEAALSNSVAAEHLPGVGKLLSSGRIQTARERFAPSRLQFDMGCDSANVLLLDPTYNGGYRRVIEETISVCKANDANVLLMVWAMEQWGTEALLNDSAESYCSAAFSDDAAKYRVFLLFFGPSRSRLEQIASSAVTGW